MRFIKAFGQALQCGLVHLWVWDLMVLMLMGVISPGGGGCPGRAAFTSAGEGGVSPVANLGRGREEGGERGFI